MTKKSDNVLSEPFLGELADRESEIHSKHSMAAESDLVRELKDKLEQVSSNQSFLFLPVL